MSAAPVSYAPCLNCRAATGLHTHKGNLDTPRQNAYPNNKQCTTVSENIYTALLRRRVAPFNLSHRHRHGLLRAFPPDRSRRRRNHLYSHISTSNILRQICCILLCGP